MFQHTVSNIITHTPLVPRKSFIIITVMKNLYTNIMNINTWSINTISIKSITIIFIPKPIIYINIIYINNMSTNPFITMMNNTNTVKPKNTNIPTVTVRPKLMFTRKPRVIIKIHQSMLTVMDMGVAVDMGADLGEDMEVVMEDGTHGDDKSLEDMEILNTLLKHTKTFLIYATLYACTSRAT